MNKIRIAYIVKNLRINGISTAVLNYSKNMNKEKYDITIFASQPIDEKNRNMCKENMISLVEIPKKKSLLKYILCLNKYLDKDKFDIVHIHGNSATICLELIIAKIKKIKVLATHSHNTSCSHMMIHKVFTPLLNRLSNLKLSCGQDAGKWMYKNDDFTVIPNGFVVDEYRFDNTGRKSIREKLNIDDGIVIGHVGRFTEQKNHEFIIDTFEKIVESGKKFYLLLVGNGPNYSKIKERVGMSKYKDRVIFYGETDNVRELYDAMDLFILPSKHEGLVIVLLEAQAKGLKCFVSSNVSKEGIFNLNETDILDLSLGSGKWAGEIVNSKVNSIEYREEYIKNHHRDLAKYNIYDNVKFLDEIYSNALGNRK